MPAAVFHFTLIWPVAGRFLLTQANAAWEGGKTVESKRITETAVALIESLRSVVRGPGVKSDCAFADYLPVLSCLRRARRILSASCRQSN